MPPTRGARGVRRAASRRTSSVVKRGVAADRRAPNFPFAHAGALLGCGLIMKRFATMTVIGRDKTGVVARVTSFLFEQKANIEALEEQVTRGQFSMTIQASWKDRQLSRDTVFSGLERLASQLEMEIKICFTEPRRRQRMALMVT